MPSAATPARRSEPVCRYTAAQPPSARADADRAAAALLAGIQDGVGIMLATGDLSYLEAALDETIGALRNG